MHILVTNDDGIDSPSLAPLAAWAEQFGQVRVIAPRVEQSGKSHAIDFHHPLQIKQVTLSSGMAVWSVDSTPADCVRFGVLGLKERYDLVISGINSGYNLGYDIVYSGTVGAIFEAARQGMKGIALSGDYRAPAPTAAQLDVVKAYFDRHQLLERCPHWNVNIPPVGKEIRVTRQGGIFYTDDFVHQGNDMYLQIGSAVKYEGLSAEIDIAAVEHGYISLTPLMAERTDLSVFHQLKEADPV